MKLELFLTKPNIIHIRRGDYVNLKALHGLVGLKYYLQSMEIVESINPGKPFWIFSDDIDMAFEEYGRFFPKKLIPAIAQKLPQFWAIFLTYLR